METRIFRQDMCRTSGLDIISRQWRKTVKLRSGSPMPMKTARSGHVPVNRCVSLEMIRSCAVNSFSVRFLLNPVWPVLQNRHPMGHPTWVERQTVRDAGIGMETVSMVWPSESCRSSLMVPSVLVFWLRITGSSLLVSEAGGRGKCCVSAGREAFMTNIRPVGISCQPRKGTRKSGLVFRESTWARYCMSFENIVMSQKLFHDMDCIVV